MGKAVSMILENPRYIFIGDGPGILSAVSDSAGKTELTIESSLLKSFLEIGIVGMLPVIILYALLARLLWRYKYHPFLRQNAEIPACLFLISLQCLTHETFQTWEGSLFLVLFIGLNLRLFLELRNHPVKAYTK